MMHYEVIEGREMTVSENTWVQSILDATDRENFQMPWARGSRRKAMFQRLKEDAHIAGE
ncbi:hypothetical protein [Pseudaestuariivita rosea]|uniref:hypothetical protein n=1 Tax=Pseudaestuariivita rosea TaxID=2763263 RepID=UPI001ABBC2C8|nr:hypothetical protein [Pseudaestuariivita rosea]